MDNPIVPAVPTPTKETVYDYSLSYIQAGLKLACIHSPTSTGQCSCKKEECVKNGNVGKHPRFGKWNTAQVWIDTIEKLKSTYQKIPRMNVGIVTGEASNVICIDIDPKHDGAASLVSLFAEHSPFPPTWEAKTGSGGTHYLFEHPGSDYYVKNHQADESNKHPKLGSGIDVRGERGQFVAPPSSHKSGNKYQWVNAPWGSVPLAKCPAWLIPLIAEKKGENKRKSAGSAISASHTSEPPRPSSSPSSSLSSSPASSDKAYQKWIKVALDGERDRVINAPAGAGNDSLNIAAMNLGQLVAGGHLPESEAESLLIDWATSGGRRDSGEAYKTINSGMAAGKKDPREYTKKNTTSHTSRLSPPDRNAVPAVPLKSFATSKIVEHEDSPHRLAQIFVDRIGMYDGIQRLYFWQDNWHQWKPNENFYKIIKPNDFKAQINEMIHQQFVKDAEIESEQSNKNEPVTIRKVTGEVVNNTIQAMMSKCIISSSSHPVQPCWLGHPHDARNWLVVKNGSINLDAIMDPSNNSTDINTYLSKPTPDWFSPTCIPINFDPTAKCPKWLNFLDSTFDDKEALPIMQEWFGYCLTLETKFQKFLILKSSGGHGKGVIIAVMESLVGTHNMSAVPLEQFAERFSLYSALNKTVNLIPDANEIDRVAEGHMKSFVVGDPMMHDRKNLPPIHARPTAKLMLVANKVPYFADKSQGLWRRMLLVNIDKAKPLTNTIAGLDKPSEWVEEMPGVFNWALAGLCRLMKNGKFSESAKINQDIVDLRTSTSPVAEFIIECCEIDPDGQANKQDIFKAYRKYCEQKNFKSQNENNFYREFVAIVNPTDFRPRIAGARERYYKGISLTNPPTDEAKTSTW